MPSKSITYSNAVREILKRVNDADGDIYLARAKELVYEGISSLAVSEGVSRDDIRGILHSEVIDTSNNTPMHKLKLKGTNRQLFYNPAKIISITDDHSLNDVEHKYIELSSSEMNRINDPDYKPFDDEVFYHHRGDFIYFYPTDRVDNQKLVITYIGEPDDYVYIPEDESGDESDFDMIYSFSFIYKVIDYGVGRIREQQSGE